METTNLFYAARAYNNTAEHWIVRPTKFNREVGDVVVIDGVRFLIITVGDHETCKAAMHFGFKRNVEHVKNGLIPVYPDGKRVEREPVVTITKNY